MMWDFRVRRSVHFSILRFWLDAVASRGPPPENNIGVDVERTGRNTRGCDMVCKVWHDHHDEVVEEEEEDDNDDDDDEDEYVMTS